MTGLPQRAPRGLRWADAPTGRIIALALAVISLSLSLYVGYKYVGLINCLKTHATADARRTRAIADATDLERAADRRLLLGAGDLAALRRASLDARAHTDVVRAANPAPTGDDASCK